MTELVSLTCPTCGGKLEVGRGLARLTCAYCGNEHLVQHSAGAISLLPIAEQIDRVRDGVDRTASELAIIRLEREIVAIEQTKAALQEKIQRIGSPAAIRRQLVREMRRDSDEGLMLRGTLREMIVDQGVVEEPGWLQKLFLGGPPAGKLIGYFDSLGPAEIRTLIGYLNETPMDRWNSVIRNLVAKLEHLTGAREAELAKLEQALEEKRAELGRHRRIVGL